MESHATVFVVDDDAAVLDSLHVLLSASGFTVQTYASARAFLGSYRDHAGCLLLDLSMPEMDGLELQRELTGRGFRIPVIFITAKAEIPQAVKALKGGAMDFLEKPLDRQQLLDRIREALARDAELRASGDALRVARTAHAALTPREAEILMLLGRGLSSKAIAARLLVSHRTVEGHRSRIKEKIGAKSLSEMIALAKLLGE